MKTQNTRFKNAKNQYQGTIRRVLCVCTGGILRSPTAANVLYNKFGYNTRAVGIDKELALIPMDDVLYEWADEIVVMDRQMRLDIESKYGYSTPIIDLDIPDMFDYMDQELISMVIEGYTETRKSTDGMFEMDEILKTK